MAIAKNVIPVERNFIVVGEPQGQVPGQIRESFPLNSLERHERHAELRGASVLGCRGPAYLADEYARAACRLIELLKEMLEESWNSYPDRTVIPMKTGIQESPTLKLLNYDQVQYDRLPGPLRKNS